MLSLFLASSNHSYLSLKKWNLVQNNNIILFFYFRYQVEVRVSVANKVYISVPDISILKWSLRWVELTKASFWRSVSVSFILISLDRLIPIAFYIANADPLVISSALAIALPLFLIRGTKLSTSGYWLESIVCNNLLPPQLNLDSPA